MDLTPLLRAARDLARALEGIQILGPPRGECPRTDALLLLRLKALPELETGLELPVFVGIQGGTNVGKSTVFNALSGKILSPAVVLASATKHPLVYVHERWRGRFLASSIFPGLECRELSDPRELITEAERTNILYFRFHDDARAANVALIDSPDFDSALATNAEGAAAIAAISDVTLFVTTPQKYKDRVLVNRLRWLLALKEEVIVIFNLVEEEIVFETILDDLRSTLEAPEDRIGALRLPPSSSRHPEEEIRESLRARVLQESLELEPSTVKPSILRRTLGRVVELAGEVVSLCSVEAALKREVKKLAEAAAEESANEYRAGFRLAFPEETLAIRRALRVTEIGRVLELDPGVERSSRILTLVGGSLRRLRDGARMVLFRLLGSREGTIDPEPAAIEEYARARDKADTDALLHVLEPLRVKTESYVRAREPLSLFARELLRSHFTPEHAASFRDRASQVHAEVLGETCAEGESVFQDVEKWIAAHPARVRALAVAAIAFKIALGLVFAWALPPAEGVFAVLNPLKWIYFAAGYFLGAYIVAFIVSLRLRRGRRLRAAREAAMRSTLKKAFLDPLLEAMDHLITEKELKSITRLTREIEAINAGPTPAASRR